VSGGTSDQFESFSDNFRFDSENSSWNEELEIPVGRISDHSATYVNGSLIIFGGKIDGGLSNAVHIYAIDDNNWTSVETGNNPEPRYGHTAVVYGSSLFVFGGRFANESVNNEIWSLNLTSFEWTQHFSTETPAPRLWHTTVLLNNKWILYGGYNGASGTSDVWSFDFATLQWTEISATSPLDPRSGHVAVALEGEMFVVGGEYDQLYEGLSLYLNNNDVWSFNPTTTEWTQWCSVGTSIHPRLGARGDVATLGGTTGALIFGGLTTDVAFEAIYAYNDVWAMSLVPAASSEPVASPTAGPTTAPNSVPIKVPATSPHSHNGASTVAFTGVASVVVAAALF
jgi:N-acetylneuraminic acid mutarotase